MDKKQGFTGTERTIDMPDSVGRYKAMDLCDDLYRAGHAVGASGDVCSLGRDKPEWKECHSAFNKQSRALLRATRELTAANARIAELAAENKAQRELLGQLHDSASEYAADQSGANDPRCGVVQPITVADGEALNDALRRAAALLEKK